MVAVVALVKSALMRECSPTEQVATAQRILTVPVPVAQSHTQGAAGEVTGWRPVLLVAQVVEDQAAVVVEMGQ